MALAPKPEDFPKIRGALKFYKVFAYVTGVMLLLLCAEMVLKYGFHYSVYAFGDHGALALVWYDPTGSLTAATGLDVSTGILIAHGWLYVVYLFSDFRLWSLMRWRFPKFVQLALGGVVPFLSFIVEAIIHRQVTRYLASRESEESALVEAPH